MPLLMSFRRWWAAVFVGILLLPTLGHVLPDVAGPPPTVLEPEARWWEDAARRLDPYINNTFGFRGAVLTAHLAYVRAMGDSLTSRVLKGEHGALFLNEDKALEQSIGQLVRPEPLGKLFDMVKRLNDYMIAHGGRFVMLVPPNGHTANFELLPAYARRLKTAPTEYDLVATRMKDAGIAFVDMRPIMAEAKKTGPVHWRYDTHWNLRGALLGFNAAMAAAGRPDLEVRPDDALEPPVPSFVGDLGRLSGIRPSEPDLDYPGRAPMQAPANKVALPGVMPEVSKTDPFVPYAYVSGHPGPRILVIGDSFTQGLWEGLLAHRASVYGWMHHRLCRFDMAAVERFKPDILIYAPTERALPCKGGPAHWPPTQGAG
ncbi:alginate O-acetyltransferase AlgX-related protein [Xanthobacter autotrophicus]|uniref:alginate O-acetyltransferase AlgX-related protein n=1 Tax=Xanthobacter autotrophicus TaxID=280 RepID=UPI0024A70B38|nr:hypothetical protein [Xanthobacter autotrophicus]MDI4657494.1 hypothetical protein [Xanthobacter autotrophicus]